MTPRRPRQIRQTLPEWRATARRSGISEAQPPWKGSRKNGLDFHVVRDSGRDCVETIGIPLFPEPSNSFRFLSSSRSVISLVTDETLVRHTFPENVFFFFVILLFATSKKIFYFFIVNVTYQT